VAGLLDALDILRVALEASRQPTDDDLAAAPRAFGALAEAIREVALSADWADDRAADAGSVVTPLNAELRLRPATGGRSAAVGPNFLRPLPGSVVFPAQGHGSCRQ
jgi:hypothetical protein